MTKRTEIPKDFLSPDEATGIPALPASKIKKIIKTDEDVYQSNKQATMVATVATEMFVQYLTQQGLKAMVAEKKPRKTLQYKDLDNLEFLADVIPTKLAVPEARETKTAKSRVKVVAGGKKQTTLTAGLVKPTTAKTKGAEGGVTEENGMETEASKMSGPTEEEDTSKSPETLEEDVEMT
ncbi:hypothetical protein EX30DRAFT_96297 [Ascodesmis nigricans]|uniref:Transcription factor CBF/NF-Y/archaeal histone domain-containing protein n=1 Tax=Ascodesmis nigricans TaxID=341454 RepID=A0A4S2N4I3_9PEZI|nr:hypothetical protein EX30DRAFT_96297 [Ascodesmis nigricans]